MYEKTDKRLVMDGKSVEKKQCKIKILFIMTKIERIPVLPGGSLPTGRLGASKRRKKTLQLKPSCGVESLTSNEQNVCYVYIDGRLTKLKKAATQSVPSLKRPLSYSNKRACSVLGADLAVKTPTVDESVLVPISQKTAQKPTAKKRKRSSNLVGSRSMKNAFSIVCCHKSQSDKATGASGDLHVDSNSFDSKNVEVLPLHTASRAEEILKHRAKSVNSFLLLTFSDGTEVKIVRDNEKVMLIGIGSKVAEALRAELGIGDNVGEDRRRAMTVEDYEAIVKASPNNKVVRIAEFVSQAVLALGLASNPSKVAAMIVDIFNVDSDLYFKAGLNDRNRLLDKEVLDGKRQLNSALLMDINSRELDGRTTSKEDCFFVTITLLNVIGFLFAHGMLLNRKNAKQDITAQLCLSTYALAVRSKHIGRICHRSPKQGIVYAKEGKYYFSAEMHRAMRYYCLLYGSKE